MALTMCVGCNIPASNQTPLVNNQSTGRIRPHRCFISKINRHPFVLLCPLNLTTGYVIQYWFLLVLVTICCYWLYCTWCTYTAAALIECMICPIFDLSLSVGGKDIIKHTKTFILNNPNPPIQSSVSKSAWSWTSKFLLSSPSVWEHGPRRPEDAGGGQEISFWGAVSGLWGIEGTPMFLLFSLWCPTDSFALVVSPLFFCAESLQPGQAQHPWPKPEGGSGGGESGEGDGASVSDRCGRPAAGRRQAHAGAAQERWHQG